MRVFLSILIQMFKKTKNSDLLNVIFNLNEIKAANNVNKGFLNGLPLKGNAEQLSISLLKIPEVEKSLDEFIINIKSFIEKYLRKLLIFLNNTK